MPPARPTGGLRLTQTAKRDELVERVEASIITNYNQLLTNNPL